MSDPTPAPTTGQTALDAVTARANAIASDLRTWKFFTMSLTAVSFYLAYRAWSEHRALVRVVRESTRRGESLRAIRRLAGE